MGRGCVQPDLSALLGREKSELRVLSAGRIKSFALASIPWTVCNDTMPTEESGPMKDNISNIVYKVKHRLAAIILMETLGFHW